MCGEADIEYPVALHDLHNDLPFLPENLVPPTSKFQNKKLIASLVNKSNYVIHYRNLKQSLRAGLIVTKIHRVLTFKQSNWLQKYIDLNTSLRQRAANDIEKDFYKLFNNCIYGKTVENVDKRVDVKLVSHWEDHRKRRGARSLIAKLNFKSISIFTDKFAAIQMGRLKAVYNKPIYIGFSVLDLSKLLMYDFYYNYLKRDYGENVSLCYMYPDSFILKIQTDDIYCDMTLNLNKFDTSNFARGNVYNLPIQNKAVLGLFKDELGGKNMTEFVALRAKVYALHVEGRDVKRSKGVKKNVVRDQISLEDYRDCLFNQNLIYRQQNLIKSVKHDILSTE